MIYRPNVSPLMENDIEENDDIVEESGLDLGTIVFENTYNDYKLFEAILASDHSELLSEAVITEEENKGKFATIKANLVKMFDKAVSKVIGMLSDAIGGVRNAINSLKNKLGKSAKKDFSNIDFKGAVVTVPDIHVDDAAYAEVIRWIDKNKFTNMAEDKIRIQANFEQGKGKDEDQLKSMKLNAILNGLESDPAVFMADVSAIKNALYSKMITRDSKETMQYQINKDSFEHYGKVVSEAEENLSNLINLRVKLIAQSRKFKKALMSTSDTDPDYVSRLRMVVKAYCKAIAAVMGAAIKATFKKVKHNAAIMRAIVRFANAAKKDKKVVNDSFIFESFLMEAADEVEKEINEPEDYKAPEEECDADASDNDFSGDEEINNTVTVTVDDSDEVNIEVNGDGDENGPDVQNSDDDDDEDSEE